MYQGREDIRAEAHKSVQVQRVLIQQNSTHEQIPYCLFAFHAKLVKQYGEMTVTDYTIQQIDLFNKKQVKAFLHLPATIYNSSPLWVPPLQSDSIRMLNVRKNLYFKHSTAAFFLALDSNNNPVARLACLNHHPYNDYNHEKTAFFYLFEAVDLPGISIPLFEAAFTWARQQGLTRIIGPRGFSALDGLGLLSEGFEYRPALGIPYNPSYYINLIEEAGFSVTEEIVSGFIDQDGSRDPKIDIIAQRVQERRGLSIARFRTKNDLHKRLPELQSLYNDAIKGTSGNFPITVEEARIMANQILWYSDPTLIKIVMKETRPVGFLFAYPDVSAALQRVKGRLFPFGWLDILVELRRTRTININGAGMIEEFRGSGGTAILLNELVKSIEHSRYTHGEVVQVNAKNERMLQELSNFGITFHKKHRLYSRMIE